MVAQHDFQQPSLKTLSPPPWKTLAACLTREEAATYLKSILNVGSNPTVGNFYNTRIGDARKDSTLVTHGSSWIVVTRHYSMHAKVKPGHSTVEADRADRRWCTEPGLYNARLQKSFHRSASTPTTKQDKKNQKDKKKSSNYKNYVSGQRYARLFDQGDE
jgi:hypothetical protein